MSEFQLPPIVNLKDVEFTLQQRVNTLKPARPVWGAVWVPVNWALSW